jgi:hypothetical protein
VLDKFGSQRDQIIGGNVEKISAPGVDMISKNGWILQTGFRDNDVLFEYQCRRLDTGEKSLLK